MSKKPTVFVAMSGGVDSSVATTLLKKQGYDVVGVFMKNWSPTQRELRPGGDEKVDGAGFCKTEEDFRDMRSVCQHLDIPHYTFNFEKEYRKLVLDYFFAEYKAGRTPNPDVMCNKEIKFGLFFERALKLGADFVATGHHIRIEKRDERIKNKGRIKKTKKRPSPPSLSSTFYSLLKGKDPIKDQTYFVYNLNQKQLAKCLFPIGEYTKPQIRAIAKRMKLPTADKKDSQGICFIGPVDVKKFLRNIIKTKRGKIVNLDGKALGEHEGAWFYTIGQRRIEGLSGQKMPLYVVRTDVKKNLVIVGPDSATYSAGVVLEDLHLVDPAYFDSHPELGSGSRKKQQTKPFSPSGLDSGSESGMTEDGATPILSSLFSGLSLTAKPRYGPDVYPGKLAKSGKKWSFVFDKLQRALTPGQSLVIYDKEVCLGGGVIKRPI